MEFSSLSKQKHVLRDSDYWVRNQQPLGLIAKRSSESGANLALIHENTRDGSFDRFETSAKHFHNEKPIKVDQEEQQAINNNIKSTEKLLANANSPYNMATTFQQHCSGAIAPYGPLHGRGTQRTKGAKLREICGGSAMAGNYDMMIAKMSAKEIRPRPGKKPLIDGYHTALSHQKSAEKITGPFEKGLDRDDSIEYIKVPCKFKEW